MLWVLHLSEQALRNLLCPLYRYASLIGHRLPSVAVQEPHPENLGVPLKSGPLVVVQFSSSRHAKLTLGPG